MYVKGILLFTAIIISIIKAYPQESICNSDENYRHVIITSNSLKQETGQYTLSHLKEHRIENGLSCTITAIEDITANYEGRDDAEKMRNFIKDAKTNWETEYVLLAGDTNILPYRSLYALNVAVSSDMYFACLDGDFNANNNDKWGEPDDDLDFEYDIYIGRASAENSTEMSNFVYKTITYENSPKNASYHNNAVQYNANTNGIGNTKKWVEQYLGIHHKLTMEYHFLTPPASDEIILPRLSSGNVGYYLGASHGTINGIGNVNKTEARDLENGDKFFFVASIACLTGRFEMNCVAEHLTTSSRNGGAFAGFFNSQPAYGKVSQYLVKMRDAYLINGITQLGPLRAEIAKRFSATEYINNSNYRYLAYEFNLLGDPATIWKMRDSESIDLSLKFENNDLNALTDHSGNGHTTSASDGLTTIESDYGKALNLQSQTDYLSVTHNKWAMMGDQKELTIMLQVNPTQINGDAMLLSKGSNSYPFMASLTDNGKIKFDFNINNPENALKTGSYTSEQQVIPDQWNHIAIRVDLPSDKIAFFFNGSKGKEESLPSGYNIGASSEPLFIGANTSSSIPGFTGLIDDIHIYSRSLSEDEISKFATWVDYSENPAKPIALTTSITNITDIQISWQDTCERVHNYILEYSNDSTDWTTLGTFNYNRLSYLHTGLNYNTKFYYRVKALNNVGESSYAYSQLITTPKMPNTDIPAPWAVRSIGNQTLNHYTIYQNDTVFMEAAEKDIWDTDDSFNYMYMPISGNAEILVKVESLKGEDDARMGGVMMRETLDTDSKHAAMLVIQAKGTILRHRDATGGTTSQIWNNGGDRVAPYWVKLTRQGDWFKGYHSADGLNWTLQEEYQISMQHDIYAGIAATSHSETSSMNAVFTNIEVNDDVAVNKTNTAHKVKIYPNPADNFIIIESNKRPAKIEIYDLSGNTIKTVYNTNKIKIYNLQKGMYIVKTIFNDGSTSHSSVLKI